MKTTTTLKAKMVAAIIGCLLTTASAACGYGDMEHDPPPGRGDTDGPIVVGSYPTYALTPPSIEEEIFKSETIVRATLTSTASGTEEDENGRYTPFNKLTFEVHEYLKGDGPNQLEVIVNWKSS